MERPVVFFGEGKADERFLQDFIKHYFEIEKITYKNVNGKDSIHLVKNEFEKNTDQGGVNLLIFDADSDVQAALKNINEQKAALGIEFETFLFPNNADIGALEELLITMTVPQHQGIFDCFQPFNVCLTGKNPDYHVPDLKTQIFSYLSFQRLESKEDKRDYTLNCWNLDADYAKPLVDFLRPYLEQLT